ncbi:MAG: 4Fe-4S binding protein [Chlamydiota bacterium]
MKQSTAVTLRRLRRLSQAAFLLAFLALVFHARYSSLTMDLAAGRVAAPATAGPFFDFDPFAALGLLVSTWSLRATFLWAIATAATTLLLGRFFCGWVCPFGTLHQVVGRLAPRRSRRRRLARASYSRAQALKYCLLIALLAAAGFTLLQPVAFDPLCILSRGLIFSIFPAVHFAAARILAAAMDSGLPALANPAAAAYGFLERRELIGEALFFRTALSTGMLLAVLLLANLVWPRAWCRFLCPLGALLGLLSRLSPVRLFKDRPRCTSCGRCALLCQGGASPEGAAAWKKPECLLCLNCQAACPEDVLGFGFREDTEAASRGPDLTRRALIASVAGGLFAAPLLRGFRARVNRARLIRPPGALPEPRFLAACLRCGTCTRICPKRAIHSTVFDAGVEGIWTPRIIPRIGYCVYSCTLCGQVCPSGAIRALTLEQKKGSDRVRPVKLGTAVVDRERCIPWSQGMTCIACEEVCPVSPKAITEDVGPGLGPKAEKGSVGRPAVDSYKCVGCGRCEHICPVEGEAAIRVYALGESRAEKCP